MPYEASRAAQCANVPCWVTSYTVEVANTEGDGYVFTLVDGCGIVTNISMLSKVLRKALAQFLEDNTLDPSECGCCRDAVGAEFDLADKTMTIDIAGSPSVLDDLIVVPPFAAG